MEFSVITKKGFTSYFLVVHEIVQFSDGITCGRGSGASSLICYLLGITHVDPIKHNLFFDRFLNLEREDPPDIDIDFPWDERDELLEKVFSHYHGHVAMVANQLFLRERMAIREVARVYGVSEQETTHVVERLHLDSGKGLSAKWKMIVSHGLRLVGCLRHLSVHCGGVVITPKKITHYGPVQKTPKGLPILQWEKDQTEMAGLIKIDLLGNRSLAVVRDTINRVNEIQGENKLNYSDLQSNTQNFAFSVANVVTDIAYGAYKYLWQPSTQVLRVPVKESRVLASYSNDSDSESEYDDSSISESSDDYNIKFGLNIPYIDFRRNVITKGVKLNDLVGKKIKVGHVKLEAIDLCRPCRHLTEMLNQNNIIKEFLRKGGLRCQILNSSKINIGDKIEIIN